MNQKELQIIPTLFSKSIEEFHEKFNKVKDLTNYFHIDIMDGNFVESRSVKLDEIDFIKDSGKEFGVHLMCFKPEWYFDRCRDLGIKNVWIHYEAFESDDDVRKALEKMYLYGFGGGLAINPQTSIQKIKEFTGLLRAVMIMAVVPGAQGQTFISTTYDKIKWASINTSSLMIQVDGGVKEEEISRLIESGAHHFCVGSYLNEADNPWENFEKLKGKLHK